MSGPTLKRISAPPLSILLCFALLLQVIVTAVSDQNNNLTKEEVEILIRKTFSSIIPPPPSSKDCKCVPYYLCRNNTINTNGEYIIDIRSNNIIPDDEVRSNYLISDDEDSEKKCPHYLDVCCDVPQHTDPPIEVTTEYWNGCGKWNNRGVGFKILGNFQNEAEFGEFPSLTAILQLVSGQSKIYICAGSLIHPKVVLTAAHCVRGVGSNDLVIRAGEWDSQTKNEIIPHQDRQVSKVIIHEKYYAGALYNDVALIIVTQPFLLRLNVGTMCLPSRNYVFSKERCFASGWGKSSFGQSGEYQVILKKVQLPIMPRTTCLDLLRKTRLGTEFNLHESFICAGGKIGKDTCEGDGGGPLMCLLEKNPKQLHQAGIVSWGIGCGSETPGVYANVAYLRNWIDEQMAKENLNTIYYDPDYVSKN